jgi:hypothetical protein
VKFHPACESWPLIPERRARDASEPHLDEHRSWTGWTPSGTKPLFSVLIAPHEDPDTIWIAVAEWPAGALTYMPRGLFWKPLIELAGGLAPLLDRMGVRGAVTWRRTDSRPTPSCPWVPSQRVVRAVPRVYFISDCNDVGPIKIGVAECVDSRLEGLQTGSPVLLKVLATVPGGYAAERKLHRRFSATRLHGEWFERTPALLREIAAARCSHV